MRNLFTLGICVVCIFISGCSNSYFISQDEIKEQLNITSLPDQNAYPEADAVVLWENHDVQIIIDESYYLTAFENVHVVKKLFKNIEANSIINIDLNSGEHIDNLCARTTKPDGSVIELKNDDFYFITGTGGKNDYQDGGQIIRFTFPALEKNCVTEYFYTIKRDEAFLFDSWQIQGHDPKLINIYSLTLPNLLLLPQAHGGEGWNWRYYFANGENIEPKYTKNANSQGSDRTASGTFQWEMKEVPGFEIEDNMPPVNNYMKYVKFAPSIFKTWNEVSKSFYNKIFAPKLNSSGEISLLAKLHTTGCKTEDQMIDSIFNFVKTINYVDVDIFESGLKPHTPAEILKNNYADCKDKAVLLISLLKAVNIKALPILIRTSDKGVYNENFPSWPFNHMIVRAVTKNDKTYCLDASESYSKAGELPYYVEGVKGLAINEDGTCAFVNMPESKAQENSKEYNVSLAINDKLDGVYSVSIKHKGELNSMNRNLFKEKTKKEIEEYCKKLVADNFLNIEITNCKTASLDDSIPSFVLSFDMKIPNIIKNQQDLLLLDYDPFPLFKNIKWLTKEKRIYPVQLDYPYQVKKYCEITLPAGMLQKLSQPADKSIFERGFIFKKRFIKTETDKLVATEEVRFAEKFFSGDDYTSMRNSIEIIKKKSAENLIIKSTN